MPESDKAQPYTYTGNPGYEFFLPSGRLALDPGDTVDLTDAEAASLGDEFQPAKPKPAAKAAPTPEDDK